MIQVWAVDRRESVSGYLWALSFSQDRFFPIVSSLVGCPAEDLAMSITKKMMETYNISSNQFRQHLLSVRSISANLLLFISTQLSKQNFLPKFYKVKASNLIRYKPEHACQLVKLLININK